MVALDIDLHHYPADDHDDIHDDADDSHMVAMVIDLHHYPAADDDDDYDFHDDADDSHIVYDSDMATSGRAAAMVAWSGLIQSSASRYTSYSAFPISSPIAWVSIMIRISTMHPPSCQKQLLFAVVKSPLPCQHATIHCNVKITLILSSLSSEPTLAGIPQTLRAITRTETTD